MITAQGQLDELCERVSAAPVVGVDTEYLTDRRFWPELCLIQIGTEDEQVLVDPMVGLDLAPLGKALNGDGPVVVMHNASADAPLLIRATGCPMPAVFDTMIAAGFVGSGELSLASVVQRYLGESLTKGATLTDWSRRPLPDGAVRYAIDDVVHLPPLWRRLSAELERRERTGWVDDEVQRSVARALDPPDPRVAWRKVENARRLRGVSLAVAVEVAAWRTETAMRLNRPVKRVLGDLGVLAISESKPSTLDALATQRGVDGGVVRDHGAALLDAIARGVAADPETWPPRASPPPPEIDAVLSALGLAARMTANEAGIAGWLAYERDDLAGLVQDPPKGRLSEGWRAEVLAPPLLAFLNGERSLRIERRRLRFAP